MAAYTLLTGATGLVGRYLVRDLLLEGNPLAVLVRPNKKATAAERVEEILQAWEAELGYALPRPVVLEGDVTKAGLGLNEAARRWVARHCCRAIHNAAVLTFFAPNRQADPWRTNVQGTENLLTACRELGIFDLHYMSTAYVCGKRSGPILEDELYLGQEFRNDYEESKCKAERMVRAAKFLDQLTVYRPAVISGDSRTGYTNTYHGVYFYLRLVSLLLPTIVPDADGRRYTPLRVPLDGDERRNVVPVDWVSDVFRHLFHTSAAHGGTYHLAPSQPLTSRQLVEYSYDYFNSYGVEFVGQGTHLPAESLSEFEERYFGNHDLYEIYETTDPQFDLTNLQRFAADLPCPAISRAMLHRYYRFGEEDRWGKRRTPASRVPLWVGDYLAQAVTATSAQDDASPAQWVSLDVLGPGGGRWSLQLQGGALVGVAPGQAPECRKMLHLTAEAFAQLHQSDTPLSQIDVPAVFMANGEPVDVPLASAVLGVLFSSRATATANGAHGMQHDRTSLCS